MKLSRGRSILLKKKQKILPEMTKEQTLSSVKKPFWQKEYFLLAAVFILTIILYLPALNNGFTNWDDTWYVTENARIADASWQGLSWWFTNYYHGQYSPVGNVVTVLLFQIDGLNPFWYHLTSVLLHLINVLLVFTFIKRLSSNGIPAVFVALFFAIHPLQTESIAWVAAIKIPLYVMFTLVSLLLYLRYIDSGKWKYYFLAFIPFLLAFGSKEQSLAIVGSLFFIDYYKDRKVFSGRVLLEKLPWLVLGILMGLNSIAATDSFGIVTPATTFGFNEQLVLPSYAFITYLWKLIFPVGMTAIYPYPSETSGLSWYYYLCFALVLILIAVVITQWKKNKTLVFGIGFFVVNILLVLQIVPTRNIIIADRYVYLPMLGFFFILGSYYMKIFKRGAIARALMLMLLLIWVTGFSMHSFNRNRIWESPETLWTDVVEKQPDALIAWYDLAGWYAEQNRHEEAIEAYLEVLRINPTYYNGLYNVANSYYRLGEYRIATAFYKKALDVRPGSKSAAMNIFMALVAQERYDEARQVIQILEKRYPGDAAVEAKKAFLPENDATGDTSGQKLFSMAEKAFRDGDLPEAIELYSLAIEKLPDGYTLYYNRGNAYFILGEFDRAIEDYTAALELDESFADCWYNRGMAFYSLGDLESFCNDMKRSAQLGNVKAAEKVKKECD
ncbi:MAG: hypothetical protein C0593_05445 [Marinilabiliales bacterium]|nr:MAG: hypothetical protein C0593_05445 [Marinilabiliales bacterium]